MATLPGVREEIYLGGYVIASALSSFGVTWEVAETRQRARDGSLLVHRASPFTGAPERFTRGRFAIQFNDVAGADIDALNDMIAWGGPFDFCPWRPVTESFWCPAATFSGTLSRRNAVDVITGGDLPLDVSGYALVATAEHAGPLTVTLGTIDAAYHTPWTAAEVSTGERVLVRYYPVYRVYVGEGQPSFDQPHRQGQTLTLEEA